ncbi:MAG: hypothetical protein KGR46_10925 [Verrucomicrobia bacterium]|nr:hypothetical protein [Verrucomicrobiota bacterium]
MKTYLTLDKQLRSETDAAIIANLERKGWVPAPQPAYDPVTQQCEWVDGAWVVTPIPLTLYTAEQWLAKEGYGATQLVTLLNLEAQLAAAAKTSPALTAVKAWTNNLLAAFVADPAPRADWPPAPHTFAATVTEAYALL